jgi:hypothetical protein
VSEQGSQEWLRERAGKVTASRIADLMAKTKSGYGASRANYAAQLIAERLTGCVAPSFTNAAMIHGTETEPEARRAYEFFVDCDVQQVGFVPHPIINMAGASPDGLVGTDGLLELMRLFVKRVNRDAEAVGEIETEIRAFLTEIAAKVEALSAAYTNQLEAA